LSDITLVQNDIGIDCGVLELWFVCSCVVCVSTIESTFRRTLLHISRREFSASFEIDFPSILELNWVAVVCELSIIASTS
jgi:4-hydroxy-3-methylbut-2-enyl diphosphate reductase IspH